MKTLRFLLILIAAMLMGVSSAYGEDSAKKKSTKTNKLEQEEDVNLKKHDSNAMKKVVAEVLRGTEDNANNAYSADPDRFEQTNPGQRSKGNGRSGSKSSE